MLRSHIGHCIYGCVFCLQRGTIHRRQWEWWKAHDDVEEMIIAIVQMGDYVQTMGRETATVVFVELIAIAIASWWETAAAE